MGDFITDNPLTINPISTSNEGIYYAYFSDPPEQLYCRIQNKKTKRFLTLYGNVKATSHNFTADNGNSYQDGFIFTNSLKLIDVDNAKGNPMTVFLRTGSSAGIGITNLSNIKADEIAFTSLPNTNTTQYLTMENTSKGVRIYTTISSGNNSANSYLIDENDGEWAVMKSMEDLDNENIYWNVYLLKEDIEGSFVANTKSQFTQNGKYYTTMYTYFPYKLLDNNVKAYYFPIDNENDVYDETTNTAHFKDIPTGDIVPAKTAVVIESTTYIEDGDEVPVINRLLPLTEEEFSSEIGDNPDHFETNFLKGYTYVYGRDQLISNNTENPNKFILSQLNGKLGWYFSKSDHMTPNKAYFDLKQLEDYLQGYPTAARTIKFTFGDDNSGEATGVIAPNYADEVDGPLFDLNGRRVTNGDAYGLKKGIYISNGKKIVVK